MSKQTEKIKQLVEKREQACLGGGQTSSMHVANTQPVSASTCW